jgi:hypothetical protein
MVSLQFRKMKTNQNSFLIIKVASSEPRQDENRFRGMSGVSASICGKKTFFRVPGKSFGSRRFTFVSPMQAKGPSGGHPSAMGTRALTLFGVRCLTIKPTSPSLSVPKNYKRLLC